MAALTYERDTPERFLDYVFEFLMKGNVKAYSGGIAMLNAGGYVIAGADTAGCHVVGRLQATQDTTAAGPLGLLADGVQSCEIAVGIFEWDNPAGAHQLVQADVGGLAYVLSDHEVCEAAGTVNSIIAGRVLSVDTVANKAVIDMRHHAAL